MVRQGPRELDERLTTNGIHQDVNLPFALSLSKGACRSFILSLSKDGLACSLKAAGSRPSHLGSTLPSFAWTIP